MNILILEDEIPAYQKIISNLTIYFNEKITHHWARSNKDGLVFLKENNLIYTVRYGKINH